MAALNIEQRPDDDVTVIEGTVYHNDLLRVLGRSLTYSRGPFVVERCADGAISVRSVQKWPEDPETPRIPGDGLRKLREVGNG